MGDSILSRVSVSTTEPSVLTPLQAKVDAGVASTRTQLIDPYNIASWLIGTAAYGLVRRTGIRVGEEIAIRRSDFYARGVLIGLRRQDSFLVTQLTGFYDKPFTTLPSLLSVPVAAVVGSGTQVLSRRTLVGWAGKETENTNRWKWSGKGGIGEEFHQSLFNYGGGLVGGEVVFRGNAFVFQSDLSLGGKLGLAFLLTTAAAGGYYGLTEIGRLTSPAEEPKP